MFNDKYGLTEAVLTGRKTGVLTEIITNLWNTTLSSTNASRSRYA